MTSEGKDFSFRVHIKEKSNKQLLRHLSTKKKKNQNETTIKFPYTIQSFEELTKRQ